MQDWNDVDMPLETYNKHCVAIRQLETACKNLCELSSMTQLYYYAQEMERAISTVQELTAKYIALRKEML